MSFSPSLGGSSLFDMGDDTFAEQDDVDTGGELASLEYSMRDSVIFLVDCHAAMLDVRMGDSHKSYFQEVFEIIASVFRNKIISSPDDLLGICFFGTKETKNLNGFEHIYVWRELEEVDAQSINKVLSLSRNDAVLEEFKKEVGFLSDGEPEFHKALWICSTLFGQSSKKNFHKRIFLFTVNDYPNKDSRDLQTQSIQKMRDLDDLDIELQVFGLTKEFDHSKFFNKLLSLSSEEADMISEQRKESLESFKELKFSVRAKQHKKRALMSCNIQIGSMNIAVKVYVLVNKARISSPTWLDAKTNEPLSIESSYICQYSGRMLEATEMRRAARYGDAQAIFDDDELRQAKSLPDTFPGIKLIGFKSKDTLKIWHNYRSSYFLFPSEHDVKGSIVAFRALIQQTSSLGKYGIALFSTRRIGSCPRMVALVPQEEKYDENGELLRPCGLHMIFLPYMDDLRDSEPSGTEEIDEQLIERASAVVESLRLQGFSPDQFENPALQHHYATLQALALSEKISEEVEDFTLPDEQQMATFYPVIDAFAKALNLEDEAVAVGLMGTKRKPTSASGSSKKSKAAASEGSGERDLNKLTVAQLKMELEALGLSKSGRKAELVERLQSATKSE